MESDNIAHKSFIAGFELAHTKLLKINNTGHGSFKRESFILLVSPSRSWDLQNMIQVLPSWETGNLDTSDVAHFLQQEGLSCRGVETRCAINSSNYSGQIIWGICTG